MAMRVLKLQAALHGSVWNASEAGRSLGVSYHSANRYLDFLEGTYLIRRLLPYARNIGKRLTRSPRVFWRDTGLLHRLWGLSNPEALRSHPQAGRSWEGFVIEQALASLALRGRNMQASFVRTQDGREIDLVLEGERSIWAIEVKASTRAHQEDLAALDRKAKLIGAGYRVLVTAQSGTQGGSGRWVTDLPGLLRILCD
jgi:hypothetical protein